MDYGPLDRGTPPAPSELRIGIVGTPETVEEVRGWLDHARSGVPAKASRLQNLFPPFPGFSEDSCFGATLKFHEKWCAPIGKREIERACASGGKDGTVGQAVDIFLGYARDVIDQGGPQVLICVPPGELLAALESGGTRVDPLDSEIDEGTDSQSDREQARHPAFHDLLKARGMALGVPIQMVRPETYSAHARGRRKKRRKDEAKRPLQDEATRAWNIHTALYYKAGGVPWRLLRDSSALTTCFVGISFFKSLDGDRLLTSVAQVFNERGEGVIVKGGPAKVDKEDRQPHLALEDAKALLRAALGTYRREHKTSPARVVVHKTSKMTEDEIKGFGAAADEERIEMLDLLAVRRSYLRLFRTGTYPPLRGTFLDADEGGGILYLRGSVDFFQTYPGLYVPRPLEFCGYDTASTPLALAREMLSLSKLNWNNTQFDGGEPITVRAARRVGDILKCLPEGGVVQPSFRFFM